MTSRHVRRAIAASCMVFAVGCAMAPAPRRGPSYAEEPAVRTEEVPGSPASPEPPSLAGAAPPISPPTSSPAAPESPKKSPAPPPPPPVAVSADAAKSDASRSMPRPTAAPSMRESDEIQTTKASGGGGSTAGPAAPSPQAPVILPGPPAIQIAAAQANFEEANRQLGSAGGDCAKLCKALASMQRATDRLCGLVAGSNDLDKRRCTDARAKLTAATAKVNATCGSCGT